MVAPNDKVILVGDSGGSYITTRKSKILYGYMFLNGFESSVGTIPAVNAVSYARVAQYPNSGSYSLRYGASNATADCFIFLGGASIVAGKSYTWKGSFYTPNQIRLIPNHFLFREENGGDHWQSYIDGTLTGWGEVTLEPGRHTIQNTFTAGSTGAGHLVLRPARKTDGSQQYDTSKYIYFDDYEVSDVAKTVVIPAINNENYISGRFSPLVGNKVVMIPDGSGGHVITSGTAGINHDRARWPDWTLDPKSSYMSLTWNGTRAHLVNPYNQFYNIRPRADSDSFYYGRLIDMTNFTTVFIDVEANSGGLMYVQLLAQTNYALVTIWQTYSTQKALYTATIPDEYSKNCYIFFGTYNTTCDINEIYLG
jgi:hypothetical protein